MTDPKKKIRVGCASATIWETERQVDGKTLTFLNVTIEKSYKDDQGEWKKTNSLSPNDIPKMILALQEAYKEVAINEAKE